MRVVPTTMHTRFLRTYIYTYVARYNFLLQLDIQPLPSQLMWDIDPVTRTVEKGLLQRETPDSKGTALMYRVTPTKQGEASH